MKHKLIEKAMRKPLYKSIFPVLDCVDPKWYLEQNVSKSIDFTEEFIFD
jgi:hypothetical protein